MDVRLDPKELLEYLQPLMEWIAEDITTRERGELAAAIYDTIDTGENCPIRPPPRRLPITKQDVEQVEVQNMFDRGTIEPCQNSWASPVVYQERCLHPVLRGLPEGPRGNPQRRLSIIPGR